MISFNISINNQKSIMGKIEFLGLFLIAMLTFSFYQMKQHSSDNKKDLFDSWSKLYRKSYNDQEIAYRFSVWKSNLEYVLAHNAKYIKGDESYELEMNAFADLPSEEFGEKYLMKNFEQTDKCTGKQPSIVNIPDSMDWDKDGAVTKVKNQGQCGSCWAFSATGSLEGAHYLSKKQLTSFSQQQLVDCSTHYGNNGCNGGWMDSAFYYVIDHGITQESKYPYRGVNGKCRDDIAPVWNISNCHDVKKNVQASLLAAIAQQPVSVAIEADHLSFQLYKTGVYSGFCGTKLDHGVLAVGYGEQKSKKFFKVKNSWGAGWGQHGYILIERTGDGKGKCGILTAASFPIA